MVVNIELITRFSRKITKRIVSIFVIFSLDFWGIKAMTKQAPIKTHSSAPKILGSLRKKSSQI
jgi:hypothetical protein